MSDALSARQTQILKALIDEYLESADPVGSELLEKKHNLGISSATIRNEMVQLTQMNYLKQPHTSAGRVPTPKAMKFYIDQLMEEKHMSLTDEVRAKEGVWDVRANIEKLMEEATHALAEKTGTLAVSALDDGRSWHSGMANVFNHPEFDDMEICANVFSFLEEANQIQDIFFRKFVWGSAVEVLFADELGWPEFEPIGMTATHFNVPGHQGVLGIVGPARLKYPEVIPVVRYFGNLIEEISK